MGNKSFIRYIKASFSNKHTKNIELLKQIRFKKKKKKRKKEKSTIHQTNSHLNGIIWTFILIHLYAYLKWYRYEMTNILFTYIL